MKQTPSLVLVVTLLMAVVRAGAQGRGDVPTGSGCSASGFGDGPVARAASRLALSVELQEEKTSQPSVSALKEAAGRIPLGEEGHD